METKKWDLYFMRIAKEVGTNTKCLSRTIGAVLVKDRGIISTGYNGPPAGVRHCNERNFYFYTKLDGCGPINRSENNRVQTCPRRYYGYKSGEGLHLCQAGHAERNALIQAAKNGITTKNTTLYCYCGLPCTPCMIEIINAGVTRLVFLEKEDYDIYSRTLLDESKIEWDTIKPEEV